MPSNMEQSTRQRTSNPSSSHMPPPMTKAFRLGAKLHYPITIQRILKRPGQTLCKEDTILEYSFKWQKVTGDDMRQIEEVHLQTTTVTWASPVDGILRDIYLEGGQTISKNIDCVLIEETCGHEIQFGGLCAVCGGDMTNASWASTDRDTSRAPISMTHDNRSLTVSKATAQRYATEQQIRLLKNHKLSLVVDLDQTIIHACIEPTVGEWQRDPNNPNYGAVKDVRGFQLKDEGPRALATGCWYYIKLRPGLQEFLATISKMYELHVYTMGTRAYAENIAKLVDPDQKLFGNRVISRDENGSLTAKSLERLFPTSTGMVAIIDDRADVWPKDRDNLIKVVPYDFFKGIGDINSSFLPKTQEITPYSTPTISPGSTSDANNVNTPCSNGIAQPGDGMPSEAQGEKEPPKVNIPELDAKAKALEDLASLNGATDTIIRLQTEEQEHLLQKQLTERPLLHLQEQLDKEDEETATSTQTTATADSTAEEIPPPQPTGQPRHNLLLDNDKELFYLTEHLTSLHHAFYEEYDSAQSHNRLAATSENKTWEDNADLSIVPNVGRVLSGLKKRVLAGGTVVLSGLVPLNIDVNKSEIGLQVRSFGASIHTRVTPRTTHLVISSTRPRTQKVRQAERIPTIKVVSQNWLTDSMSQWKKLETGPYAVRTVAEDTPLAKSGTYTDTMQVEVHSADLTRSIKETGQIDPDLSMLDTTRRRDRPGKLILKVQNAQGEEVILDADDDEGFDSDDEGTSHFGEDDEGEELEALVTYMPDDLADGESSPIDNMKTFDWGEADQELEDFLASGTEDEEDDSDGNGDGDEQMGEDGKIRKVTNGIPRQVSLGMKRKLEAGVEETDGEESDYHPGSALAKRQRISARAAKAGSLLASGVGVANVNGGPPSPGTSTGTGKEQQDDRRRNISVVEDEGDEELEADLMAMLEADDSEKG